MLLVIAALVAAAPARGEEASRQPQAQSESTRNLSAVRVVSSDAEASDPGLAPQAPIVAAESSVHSSWYSMYAGRQFGLLMDAGVPGGAGIAGMFRPWSFLRVEGGLNYNYLSVGLRGGLTLIPFDWAVTPTAHFEGGHFFDGDASRFTSDPGAKILLSHVPEDYLSASLGLEFGSQQRFVFFLRVGLTWIRTEARNVAQAVTAENSGGATTVKSAQNIPLLAQVPTLSVGALLYLF
jgi:hypothetical protein